MAEIAGQLGAGQPRRFLPYPEYRESGVAWLGAIPAYWEANPLKRSFRVVNGSTPKSGEPDNWDGDIPWVTPEDLGRLSERVLNEPARYITRQGYENCGTRMVPAGSLVLSTRAPIGHLAISGTSICTNQRCRSLVFRHSGNETHAYFQLYAARPILKAAGRGSTFMELAKQDLESVVLAVPPLDERIAIAAFLDRETAKIDALVAKKEQLIELLQEKRTALITRAVTRGLDPNVPMKDSGVAWLGDVPTHWEIVPFKRAIDYIEGPGIMAADFLTAGVPLLRISGIGARWATLDGCNYLSPEAVQKRWSHFRVRSGDLLISGSASIGFCTEVDGGIAGAIPYTGIIIIRPRAERISRNFVRWMLLSDVFATQVDLASTGSTIQHFGPSHLARMQVLAPPVHEQLAIADHVETEASRIDVLVGRIHQAIDYLHEYRTALISAAVTGKIDVRKEAA